MTVIPQTRMTARLGWLARLGHAFERWAVRRARYRALRSLDNRTLRDIGLHRSEIGSYIAEVSGEAEATRRPRDSGAQAPNYHSEPSPDADSREPLRQVA